MTASGSGRRWWPWLILLAGVVGMTLMLRLRPHPRRRPVVTPRPVVRVVTVADTVPRAAITDFGTVRSRRHVTITPQVGGVVVFVSPRLRAGDVLAAGDTLLVIDPRDYDLAVQAAGAQVARAEVALQKERHEAAIARQQWAELHGDGSRPADPLVLHEPQLRQAEADLTAARAQLQQARLNRERCVLRAPFDCRVSDETVDEGQFVAPGASLGTLYELAEAEVTVALPDGDLAFFAVPACPGDTTAAGALVRTDFGGGLHTWSGRVDRIGGNVDPQTRLVDVIVAVREPFHAGDDRPALLDGTFVTVTILGHRLPGTVALPREALRAGNVVWAVDDSSRIRVQPVAVVFRGHDTVIVRGDLPPGTPVVVSLLDVVANGMPVRILGAGDPSPAGHPAEAAGDTAGQAGGRP